MLISGGNLSQDRRLLLKHYDALSQSERETLLAFAEFLGIRADAGSKKAPHTVEKPIFIERPQEESVIGAIKRLSASYPMLDRSVLLTETSSLMSAHLMQGRKANEVIDELEALFERHYQEYLSSII